MLEIQKHFCTCHFYGFSVGLSWGRCVFSIAKNNKRWGKNRRIAQLFPKTVIYYKFNNFGTACRIGFIFEGKVVEVNPEVPQGLTTPTSGPNVLKTFKITNIILPITFDPLVRSTPK